MHYGKLGMKWGKHRAKRAALLSGRYSASSKKVKDDMSKANNVLNTRAKGSLDAAKSTTGGVKTAALRLHAASNLVKADENKALAKDFSTSYDKSAKRLKEKANRLTDKYGDAETKKQVASMLKEGGKKPFSDLPKFDSQDPVVVGVSNALTAALANAGTSKKEATQ